MVLRGDVSDLCRVNWRVLIVDEAHRIKNQNSKLIERFEGVCEWEWIYFTALFLSHSDILFLNATYTHPLSLSLFLFSFSFSQPSGQNTGCCSRERLSKIKSLSCGTFWTSLRRKIFLRKTHLSEFMEIWVTSNRCVSEREKERKGRWQYLKKCIHWKFHHFCCLSHWDCPFRSNNCKRFFGLSFFAEWKRTWRKLSLQRFVKGVVTVEWEKGRKDKWKKKKKRRECVNGKFIDFSLIPQEEVVVELEMSDIQKQYYRAILERNRQFLNRYTLPSPFALLLLLGFVLSLFFHLTLDFLLALFQLVSYIPRLFQFSGSAANNATNLMNIFIQLRKVLFLLSCSFFSPFLSLFFLLFSPIS